MRYAWIEEPPFNCATAEGTGGLDVEVMRWACARLGQPLDLRRIEVCASYGAAEAAVLSGAADAYASVALAHAVAVARHPELACVTVPDAERPRSPGGFACRTPEICRDLDDVLAGLAGSEAHAALLTRFGLGAAELP